MTDIEVDVKATLKELSDEEAAMEVERVMKAFKLNPWEQLGVDVDISEEELNKLYRKRSLMIHPDKCKHKDARTAFGILAQAKSDVTDEGKKNVIKATVEDAKAKIIHQKKISPGDKYLKTEAFKSELRKEVNRILAEIEWRKIQLQKRMTEEEGRNKIEEEEKKETRKRKAEAEKNWEDSRDTRVGEWRSFLQKGTKKKSKRRKKENDLKNDVSMKIATTKPPK